MSVRTTFLRRCLRFRLRSLLLLTLFGCLAITWHINGARRQRDAVAWVKASGGSAYYAYQVDQAGRYLPLAKPTVSAWWVERLGIDFFERVVSVSIGRPSMFGGQQSQILDLSPLADLRYLQRLSLHGRAFHSNLKPLARMRNLTDLDLGYSDVQDITPLARLTRLQELRLASTKVESLDALRTLTRLQELNLSDTPISNIASLAKMRHLEILDLSHTAVSDLEPLRQLHRLEQLLLRDTDVEDVTPLFSLRKLRDLDLGNTEVEDIKPLSNLVKLKCLHLENSQVHDVSTLSGLSHLGMLYLEHAPVFLRTLKELKKSLPRCKTDIDHLLLVEWVPADRS